MYSSPVASRAFQLLACGSCSLSLVSRGSIQLKWPWVVLVPFLVTDSAHKKSRKAKRKICFCSFLGALDHCCCRWEWGSPSSSGLQLLQPHCSTLWSILTITIHFFPSPVPLSTSLLFNAKCSLKMLCHLVFYIKCPSIIRA